MKKISKWGTIAYIARGNKGILIVLFFMKMPTCHIGTVFLEASDTGKLPAPFYLTAMLLALRDSSFSRVI